MASASGVLVGGASAAWTSHLERRFFRGGSPSCELVGAREPKFKERVTSKFRHVTGHPSQVTARPKINSQRYIAYVILNTQGRLRYVCTDTHNQRISQTSFFFSNYDQAIAR